MDPITRRNYEPLANIDFEQTLARVGHVNRVIELLNKLPIVQVINFDVATNIDISTSYGSTFVKFNQLVNTDMVFTCSGLAGNSPGDVLNISVIIDTLAPSVKLTFDTGAFYTTQCGGPQITIDLTGQERNIVSFIFDGEKWVSTFDNC